MSERVRNLLCVPVVLVFFWAAIVSAHWIHDQYAIHPGALWPMSLAFIQLVAIIFVAIVIRAYFFEPDYDPSELFKHNPFKELT
ncbi:MAG: hypothetical protein ABIB97_01120 [Patescibacteria group bacterium]